jgi:hypothetical protein
VLVNQDVVPSLIRVVSSSSGGGGGSEEEEDGLQEVAYQALYHIIIQTDLEAETLCGLSQLCLGRFSFSFFVVFYCCLIRLRNCLLVYLLQCCGSRMLISDPDFYSSLIPDPTTAPREEGENFLCPSIFCSHKYHKIVNNFIFEQEQ